MPDTHERTASKKIWFSWNYETCDGSGRRFPYPHTAHRQAPMRRMRTHGYAHNEAVKAVRDHWYDSVGFKIPEGYSFLDIDHRNLTEINLNSYSLRGLISIRNTQSAEAACISTEKAISSGYRPTWLKRESCGSKSLLYEKSARLNGTVRR